MQKKSSSLSLYFKYPLLSPEFSILPFSTQLEEKYTLKSKAKKKRTSERVGTWNCRRLSNDVTIFPSSSTKRLLKFLRGTLLCYLRLDQLADFSFTSPTTWNSTFVLTLPWTGVKFWYQRSHTEWLSNANTTWNFVVSLTTGGFGVRFSTGMEFFSSTQLSYRLWSTRGLLLNDTGQLSLLGKAARAWGWPITFI